MRQGAGKILAHTLFNISYTIHVGTFLCTLMSPCHWPVANFNSPEATVHGWRPLPAALSLLLTSPSPCCCLLLVPAADLAMILEVSNSWTGRLGLPHSTSASRTSWMSSCLSWYSRCQGMCYTYVICRHGKRHNLYTN